LIFFQSHDPTVSCSTQYISAVHTHSSQQNEAVVEAIREYESTHAGSKVLTRVSPAGKWTDAEEYHQKYLEKAEGKYRKERQEKIMKKKQADGKNEDGKSKDDCRTQ